MRRTYTTLLIMGMMLLHPGCSSDSAAPSSPPQNEKKAEDTGEPEVVIPEEEFYTLIKSIPSPLETSALILALDLPYSDEYLNTPDNVNNYTNKFKKAINLGIYGADMGYVNMYEKTSASLKYLGAVRSLAEELKVGQFFDFQTIKQLAANRNNLDELLNLSQMGFEKMNNYLQKQKRGKVSLAMLMGGWLEGLYLCTQLNKISPNDMLSEAIAEQKDAIDIIGLLLTVYPNDRGFKKFKLTFDKIKLIYDKIEMEFIPGEVVEREVNGMLVVEDTSKSIYKVTDQQIKDISNLIESLRRSLVN